MLATADSDPGAWLRESVTTFGGRVRDLVPAFPAYLRIFHRPEDGRTWGEVARTNGRHRHALMQWHRIAEAENAEPRPGELDAASWRGIVDVVGDLEVWVATWVGWGGYRRLADATELALPQRDYAVTSARLADLEPAFASNPPAYVWPADRTWLLASGIDFDSSILCGDDALLGAVEAQPTIEAFRVNDDASLASTGDTLNS